MREPDKFKYLTPSPYKEEGDYLTTFNFRLYNFKL